MRHTSDISRSIDRIGRLISDLLDSTRLNEGLFSLSLRRTELVGLTREVAETLAPMRPRQTRGKSGASPGRR